MGEHNVELEFFFGRRGRWFEIAVMGHFEDESDDREMCLVNEEKGCLSGPSFAFLLVNCREKKKKKRK